MAVKFEEWVQGISQEQDDLHEDFRHYLIINPSSRKDQKFVQKYRLGLKEKHLEDKIEQIKTQNQQDVQKVELKLLQDQLEIVKSRLKDIKEKQNDQFEDE